MDGHELFWDLYRHHEPDHAVYTTHGNHLHLALPICIHGDEGSRGLLAPRAFCSKGTWQDAKTTLPAWFAISAFS